MAAPFLTRLESYRDPQALWPLAAGLSVVAHGVLLLHLPTWIEPRPTAPDTIPVQLLVLAPTPAPHEALDSPQTPEASHPAVDQAASVAPAAAPPSPAPPVALSSGVPGPGVLPPPALPPTATSRPPAAAPSPQMPPVISPPATASPSPPSPSPSLPPTASPSPTVPPSSPAPPPPSLPPSPAPTPPFPPDSPSRVLPPAATPPAAAIPPVSLPPSPGQATEQTTGYLIPLGLRPTPYGRDWPDTPPQLLSTAAMAIPPGAWGCGNTHLGSMASPGTVLAVALRVQVEADGTVSATYVDYSSGNPALDNLVSCIGQRQLRLAPALVDGQPQVTDAYQVDFQVRF